MSKPFPANQIIRCPLCRDGGKPEHIGLSVFVCEACGNSFRVVMAAKNTGKKLREIVNANTSWGRNKEHRP